MAVLFVTLSRDISHDYFFGLRFLQIAEWLLIGEDSYGRGREALIKLYGHPVDLIAGHL